MRIKGQLTGLVMVWAAVGCSSTGMDGTGSGADASTPTSDAATGAFVLTSPDFVEQGVLPVEYTCDGAKNSPPLSWSGVPTGTVEFGVMMTTLAPDGLKWNWVLHSIPGTVRSLPKNTMGIGTAGLTSDGPLLAYSPPCSQGPGQKWYKFTVYALSGKPTLPSQPNQVTGAVLTSAISTLTLASSQLNVSYTR